jgi:ketosteroid isomerase-like protein
VPGAAWPKSIKGEPHSESGVLAHDEHAVVVVTTASREGRSVTTNDVHVFHLRDGKVVEFWDASTDQYAFDEVIG